MEIAPDGVAGKRASEISESIEGAIREGRLRPGDQLPTVRALADRLDVSPSTVSAAYRFLRQRGVISTHGRGGTRVHTRPPVEAPRPVDEYDPTLRDVSAPTREHEVAQIVRDALREIAEHRELDTDEQLASRLHKDLAADGIQSDGVVAVSSVREALSLALEAHLLPGDRIAIEAPSSTPITDVISLHGFEPVPVAMDTDGPRPETLSSALTRSAAVVLTPRAQDPTGAAVDALRASQLRVILRTRPEVFVIEWDPAGPVAGVPYEPIVDPSHERWAVIRGYDELFSGQTGLAAVAGDPATLARVQGRLLLGGSPVSALGRRLATEVLTHPGTLRRSEGLSRHYGSRRVMLIAALRNRGIVGVGQSGPHVWIPVPDQRAAADGMKTMGWLVAEGERPSPTTEQGIRVTAADLDGAACGRFADDLLEVLAEL